MLRRMPSAAVVGIAWISRVLAGAMLTFLFGCNAAGPQTRGHDMDIEDLARQLAALDTRVLTGREARGAPNMLADDIQARIRQANRREDRAWQAVRSVADWERFRDVRLEALSRSLGGGAGGEPPAASAPLPRIEEMGTVRGEGFRIRNLVIESRPGLPIAANLYVPDPLRTAMPGILLCTSHHNPKTQGELMDMGMTWARAGSMVLVMDHLGHGERRQQPFGGREDYRWRYYLGMQLYTVGESLMGWMVADLRRGIDVLGSQGGIDAQRIVLIGAVAGGGDPAAVAAAMDGRVACVVPFNFGSARMRKAPGPGGPDWVDCTSGGDFETTRCLRRSAADGFVPWVIVAGSGPRRVVFAKEFAWDPADDPAFGRIEKVFGLYGARDRLDSLHGYGGVEQSSAAASHCNNVGPVHRKALYPILERLLKMPVPQEYTRRPKAELLTCLTGAAGDRFPQKKVHELAAELARQRLAAARGKLARLPLERRRSKLREDWSGVLGGVEPAAQPQVKRSEKSRVGRATVEKVLLAAGDGIVVPLLLLTPGQDGPPASARRPAVICLAREGKGTFLARRAAEVARLLDAGVAVCLPDVRGTGETRPEGDRDWYCPAIELASQELMLGGTMLGRRLSDVRSVVRYLQARSDLDGRRLAVWGESFAPANAPDFADPPLKTDRSAAIAEPLGANLALLTGLYEDGVLGVLARGGLVANASLLDGPACHVVLDDIVPHVLDAGDLPDLAGAMAPRWVRFECPVDGRNRAASAERIAETWAPARKAYAAHPGRLSLSATPADDAAGWLLSALAGTDPK